jgi:hypothetical protein
LTALVALQAAAITLILTRGSIFEPLRSRGPALWRELSSCALCAGFWIGLAWFLLASWPVRERATLMWCFGGAALSAAAALLLVRVLDALEGPAGD